MNSFSALFRSAGYGILLLTVFDWINVLIPLQLNNPTWQFTTAGNFVERSIVPIVGFVLLFYDNQDARSEKEMILLRCLSWLSLLTGMFYAALFVILFIIPAGIDNLNGLRVDAQFSPEIAKIQQVQIQVKNAPIAQLEAMMKSNKAVTTTDPQVFKSKVLENTAVAEKNLTMEADFTKNNQKMSLLKNAVRWALGALVSAIIFIRIWGLTDWARNY